jgi:hypothetical protein
MYTDKNLGPAVMNREDYIEICLKEHLLTPTYQNLSQTEATQRMRNTKDKLENLLKEYGNGLPEEEITYFKRSLNQKHFRNPMFYAIPKVHKKPLKTRPVVSCVNSYNAVYSKWLDYKLSALLPFTPSYLKNSTDLLNLLKTLPPLPEGAKIFTADAVSMYTNIDTNTALIAINNMLQKEKFSIPSNFPTQLILKTLHIIMKENIFQFDDTFWLQKDGTAMGTPVAVMYSTIAYGAHENEHILNNKFNNNLIFYKRYIDDIFGIWIPTENIKEDQNNWEAFKNSLNGFGNLKWQVEDLTTTTHFLDLTIKIQNNKIHSTTYQKEMNLHLYLPATSAHPIGCLKGLIIGTLLRYREQNNDENFKKYTSNFITHLLNRGYHMNQLKPILEIAANIINTKNIQYILEDATTKPHTQTVQKNNQNTLYIHWQHHPSGLKRKNIREIYNKTLKGKDNFQKLTVALSRPKNLRDILTKTTLNEKRASEKIKDINIHINPS